MRYVREGAKVSKVQLGGVLVAAVAFCLLVLQFNAVPILSSPFLASVAAAWSAPTGYDPLTEQEMAALVTVAQGATAVAALPQPEMLLVERHEASKAAYAKGSWPRQGDVYLYDYATDTLIHTTVDVQSGAVTTVERVQDVQLPLTANEESRALALIAADPTLWATLAARYQSITGEALKHLTQLQVKVSVFHADVMPDRVNGAARHCGRHRCAQVLLFTVDKTLLDMTPIVDLSLGQVVQVLEDAAVQ
jgi:hypothetical protein